MNITDFEIYSELLKAKSGLNLTQDKSYLLESRLNPVAKKWGYTSISAMTHVLRAVPPKDLVNDIIEAMTTNETSFFRDKTPFDRVKDKILPYYQSKKSPQKKIRIWCAATSSGQEAYSLAITLCEAREQFPNCEFEIIASDISHEIIDQARDGIYTQFETQRGLPVEFLMKYFTQLPENKWEVNQEIKNMVTYQYFNLIDDMDKLGGFDVIFCRNVLVNFDLKTKKDVIERMHALLADDGFYILGADETTEGITDKFQPLPDSDDLFAKATSDHVNAT